MIKIIEYDERYPDYHIEDVTYDIETRYEFTQKEIDFIKGATADYEKAQTIMIKKQYEALANARLIAQAPAMYEALESCIWILAQIADSRALTLDEYKRFCKAEQALKLAKDEE